MMAAVALLATTVCASVVRPPSRLAPVRMSAPRRVLAALPFEEARAMARSMGMSSKQEWDEYDCPGAYRLPKDADVVWAAQWQGWDDWLGVRLSFADARRLVRSLGLRDRSEYEAAMRESARMERADPSAWNGSHALRLRDDATAAAAVDLGRVPIQPDVAYKSDWADFLGAAATTAADAELDCEAREG